MHIAPRESIMFDVRVSYHASCPGIEFDRIEFEVPYSGIEEACISSGAAEGVSLCVKVKDAASIPDALKQGEGVATFVSNRLSFQFEKHVSTFELKEYSSNENNHGSPIQNVGQIGQGIQTIGVSKAMTHDERQQTQDLLERKDDSGDEYYLLFRSALGLTDTLSRFMGIYNIVLLLCDDKQKEVDKFVLSVQPKVPKTQRPDKQTKFLESVYTKLRNQVGHVRKNTTIDGTKNEMAIHLEGLIEVAKELIRQKLKF